MKYTNIAKSFLYEYMTIVRYFELNVKTSFTSPFKLSIIAGLDASICQKDCENYANSEFAKQCKKDNGFFKCCVRKIFIFKIKFFQFFL